MSDQKSDEELIREAIEAGMVRKIPRGVSGDVKLKRGPAKNIMRIQRIRLLSAKNFSDLEIAEEIGSTQKAVSNTRYREGIPNGFRRRKGA